MDRIRKARAPYRASVTKITGEVERELAGDQPNMDLLELKKQKLEEISVVLQQLDQQILDKMLDDNAPEEEYEAEYTTIEDYGDKVRACKLQINKVLSPASSVCPSVAASEYESAVGDKTQKKQYKLPKIKLRTFDGDMKNWLGFWSQFAKIHDDKELHNSDKFQYLIQCMEDGTRAKKLVESYPQTEENYEKVVDALQDRFGDKVLLAEVYVRELLKFVNTNLVKTTSLSSIYDELESHLRSLESLGVKPDQSAIFLYPMVESSLPLEVIKVWQRSPLSGYGAEDDLSPKERLEQLMKFLRQEVKGEARLSYVSGGVADRKPKSKSQTKEKNADLEDIPTVAGLFVGDKVKCIFCDRGHDSKDCWKAPSMELEEKNRAVKDKKRCFACLNPGHSSKMCRAKIKCALCGGRHAVVMCPMLQKNKVTSKSEDLAVSESTTNNISSNLVCSAESVLKTLMVTIVGVKGKKKVRALLDDGSQRSYVCENIIQEIGLPVLGQESIQHSLFGGVQISPKSHIKSIVTVEKLNKSEKFQFAVLGQKKICGDLPRIPKGQWMEKLTEKGIFINDIGDGAPEVELLIGAKELARIMTGKVEAITTGLLAIETSLGWVLMGENPCTSRVSSNLAMSVTSMVVSSSSIEQLWSLETIGIREPANQVSKEEREESVKDHFLRTVTRSPDGRYKVALPWIDGRQTLVDNLQVAMKRLESTTRKLVSMNLYEDYEDIFSRCLDEGIIEEVCESEKNNKAHYLPHRAVVKPESVTTPIRPVFDASCKSGRNPSLNECLEKGPNLLELIPAIVLRFREKRFGATSDIRKAFLMIEVAEEDRDYLRFLWWESPNSKKLRVFRHKRVVFGVNCSPYLLGAVIEYHLQNVSEGDKLTAEMLRRSLYVDNCVVSIDSKAEYEHFREKATRIMDEAKMELRLWQCTIEEEANVCSSNNAQPISSVLGLKWDNVQDTLSADFSQCEIPDVVTKRVILSVAQRIFDPVGFLSPTLLLPKLLLQKAWLQKTAWDEELSEEMKSRFGKWCQELDQLSVIKIPRNATGYVSSRNAWQVHMFCDASKDAYAACIFLRTDENENVSVQLLQAKSRVAPIKRMTIPRLELMACTIGARLLDFVKKSLALVEVPTFLWSDSSTALSWIKGNDEWGTFVGNRVKEILSLTKSCDWRHVPGVQNPADLPSRGCSPRELLNSQWWEGPEWLKLPPEEWPKESTILDEDEILKERKRNVAQVLAVGIEVKADNWYARSSSYYRNLRVLALVKRFVNKCRKKDIAKGELNVNELETAEKIIIKMIQKESFPRDLSTVHGLLTEMDKEGIRRVKTKLLHRDDTKGFKMPMLLPHLHPTVDQIIMEEHIYSSHAGVQFVLGSLREKYWIVQGRKAVRRVLRKCVICTRYTANRLEVIPSALPEARVRSGKVFETVGVDLAGPLYIKGKKKAWIVLFTCAVYRCVHLELVKSLSTEAFLESFSRFVCRRGRPNTVYSDNGTNFVGTANLFRTLDWKRIQTECGLRRIQWVFNPPSAAWWGGWWERLIGSIKNLLRRVLGRSSLTFDKLRNHLCEVESVINGRPLTTVTEDPEDLTPLTPAMFLHDMPCPAVSDLDLMEASGFQRILQERKKLVEELKMRFRREYLAQLVHRGKNKKTGEVRVGVVVLVGADNRKRWEWPMAKVLELYPGRDGSIRVAKVKTANGVLTRPIQRLYPMEVSSPAEREWESTGASEGEQVAGDGKKTIILRTGRAVKVPTKYKS